jgi:hypothetical protein
VAAPTGSPTERPPAQGLPGQTEDLTPEHLALGAAALAGRVADAAEPVGEAPPVPGGVPGRMGHGATGLPLLATKLFVPRPRPDLVPRPRLLARLDVGLDAGRCSLLSAPAGAGKTSLLAAWLAQLDRPRHPIRAPGSSSHRGLARRRLPRGRRRSPAPDPRAPQRPRHRRRRDRPGLAGHRPQRPASHHRGRRADGVPPGREPSSCTTASEQLRGSPPLPPDIRLLRGPASRTRRPGRATERPLHDSASRPR